MFENVCDDCAQLLGGVCMLSSTSKEMLTQLGALDFWTVAFLTDEPLVFLN